MQLCIPLCLLRARSSYGRYSHNPPANSCLSPPLYPRKALPVAGEKCAWGMKLAAALHSTALHGLGLYVLKKL